MKQHIALFLLLGISILGAVGTDHYQATNSGLRAQLESVRLAPMLPQIADVDEGDASAPTPTITKTYAFPFHHAELQISSMLWNVYDKQHNFLYTDAQRISSVLQVAHTFQFREMAGVTIKIESQVETPENIRTLVNVDFELIGSDPIVFPETVSAAFVDAYEALADNYDQSYLRNLPLARPKMLIISHAALAEYQISYINWKRSLGFDVYVVNKADIGNSIQEIKSFIASHYQQYKCDYLFLWGDTTGNFPIPTNFYPSPEYAENDADDNYFVTLEGDDYFPEMLAGRFSFNDAFEFITMVNKTIAYEKTPIMNNTAWMKRNLVVAGNYAEGNLRPSTPISMSQWLRTKMMNHGYAQVDTVYYPPSFPGTFNIRTAINQGVQFISYRGWGDANGWHYPYFHTSDLSTTENGARMPIVFSIVCNTGDFANSVNPSFGEAWMRRGSTSTPGGCVAFVGPSDLHTKTRLNNAISSGAFRSILDLGVRGFASSVLMGKVELYKNFPNDIAPDQYVAFYYHVYNILSDPSMNMWVLVPDTIPESVIDEGLSFAQSDSHIRISAANLDGAMVSGTKNGTDFTYTKVLSGYAVLPIDPTMEGNLTITISKPNFVPLVKELNPVGTAKIGIISNSMAEQLVNPATTTTVSLGFKNFSTAAYNGVNVTISANNPGISFTQANQTISAIAPGAETSLSYELLVAPTLSPGEVIDFTITMDNPSEQQLFQLKTGGAAIRIIAYQGQIIPGQINSVQFTATNTGNVAMNDISIQLESNTTAATVQLNPVNIGTLAPGESTQFFATITLPSNVWDGRNLPLRFTASNATGYSYFSFYSVTAGTPGTNDPTGPDEYGYFAYDSSDTEYAQVPVYDWVEIDPRDGGQGQVYLVPDDGNKTVPLPFTFRFYGMDYNSVTMCSNGWISFIPSNMVDFYNSYIPAAMGPYTLVAGYWDDLKGMKVVVDSTTVHYNDMRVCYWHDTANNRYIIEWNDAYNQYTIGALEDASLEKFQIILYPREGTDGDVVVQYHTVDNPGLTTNYSTVGIEDHTQLRGLTYTHGNTYPLTATTLAAGLAIKFTTTAPDNYVSNEDLVSSLPITNLRNYPNPFNPSTTISFTAKSAGIAKLNIFNLKGQLVKCLADGVLPKGEHKLVWDGKDADGNVVSSGIYFYNLEMGSYKNVRKMLMMK
ncbi:MAG: C25 family cysteine peptidase [Candidatus Cloacimonetes bacterium]|nr:C25 family cysteine peptidase [Candidatus Cloacimonadota bacterium]